MYTWLSVIEAQSKAQNATAGAQPTIDGKAFLTYVIGPMCARFDEESRQTFAPLIDTRPYDAAQDNIDYYRNLLFLDYPLLSASEVAINGTVLTLWDGVQANKSAADYNYRHRGQTPYYALQGLKNVSTWSPGQYGSTTGGWGDIADAISVTGIWGYRLRYPTEGWRATSTLLAALNSTATSFAVAAAGGASFSPGMLIQIDSEMLSVESISTDTLTVKRGQRGSTAASHLINAPVNVWYPEPNVQRALTIMCAYAYAKRGVYEQFKVDTIGGFVSQMPPDLAEEVKGILALYTLDMFRSMAV